MLTRPQPPLHQPDDLRVLFYHRIGDAAADQSDLAPELIAATPADFARQMRHLARAYQPVSADDVLAALDGRRPLPPRAVLVTFDDGYRDVRDLAWPILQRFGVPAVLFVSTSYLDEPERIFWWDALWQVLARTTCSTVPLPDGRAAVGTFPERMAAWRSLSVWLKSLTPAARAARLDQLAAELHVRPTPTDALLTWSELRQLAAEGLTIGGHSRTHELLDQLPAERLAWEVSGCRDDLARELGAAPDLFAYPNGNHSTMACRAVAEAGFRLGFTTLPGLNQHWSLKPFTLRRDGPSPSLLRFAVKLLGPVASRRARGAPEHLGAAAQ